MKKKLTDLPNLGKEVSSKLEMAGIKNASQLKAIGSKDAFIKLQTIDKGACLSMLCALEGAIQDVRWHKLDDQTKQDLKEFFKMVNKKNS